MMGHTPGPWHVFRDEINNEVGLTVARWVEFVNEYRAEAEANASLIAAAPDLLVALKEVVRISMRKHDAWDAALAAIANAEGRQP